MEFKYGVEDVFLSHLNHEFVSSLHHYFKVVRNCNHNTAAKYIKNLKKVINLARHTFATTITLANGVPIESVSEMLGHKSIRTTQIYAKVIDKKVSEDMSRLESFLSNSAEDVNKAQ